MFAEVFENKFVYVFFGVSTTENTKA